MNSLPVNHVNVNRVSLSALGAILFVMLLVAFNPSRSKQPPTGYQSHSEAYTPNVPNDGNGSLRRNLVISQRTRKFQDSRCRPAPSLPPRRARRAAARAASQD